MRMADEEGRDAGAHERRAPRRTDDRPAATVTFLFTDIEGSTRQWEQSPAMADLVARHFDVLRAAVAERRRRGVRHAG